MYKVISPMYISLQEIVSQVACTSFSVFVTVAKQRIIPFLPEIIQAYSHVLSSQHVCASC